MYEQSVGATCDVFRNRSAADSAHQWSRCVFAVINFYAVVTTVNALLEMKAKEV